MEDISSIIKEAKPLYFARKRRNRAITALAVMCVAFIGLRMPIRTSDTDIMYDSWTTQLYMTESGSVIEDMGLPVDEYGLLMVG